LSSKVMLISDRHGWRNSLRPRVAHCHNHLEPARRPEPFDAASLQRLEEIVEQFRDADDVHAIIIAGAGDEFFSAGLLNPEIRASLSKDEVLEIVFLANRVYDAIEALPQIVIAAINGTILAGAVELALACDIRLAADHFTMMMPEAKWGGFPGAGGPVRLPGVVGHGRAMELIATGRPVTIEEMQSYRLVEHVYPQAELTAAAHELAQTIAANGPLATGGAKRIAKERQRSGFKASRDLSDQLRRELEWSEDVDEGMAAVREGRAPKFSGR
jgi:enoyl-CoA hydratase/carnithine racemase